MTQNNQRKEPVFGEPLPLVENETTLNTAENNTTTVVAQGKVESKTEAKPYVSLHSTQSPGHTFTPVMKRPEAPTETNAEQVTLSVETETENANVKAFTFTPPVEDNSTMNPPETDSNEPLKIKVDETVASEGFTTERIIPSAAAGAAVASAAAAANEKAKAKMSPKARRLLLVALLALALLVLFFLLKPNTPETVEELQSQGSSLPIEFRPVDEAEAKRAEEQARAEQDAAKQQEAQAQTPPVSQPTENTTATQNDTTMDPKPVSQAVENKPVVSQPVVKPQTQGSVVYQPETPKTQPKPQPKVERLTPQAPKETAKATAKPAEKPAAEKVAAKTTAKPEAEAAKTATKTTATATASTKTMTVPKGVSLMQVFRDNNLNIADVNAMSKVNSIVSNLKVGERVTVHLDNNNRVVEMTIGSGGKFTRQANGSYTFK